MDYYELLEQNTDDANVQLQLYYCCLNGNGKGIDDPNKWLELSAKNGNAEAKQILSAKELEKEKDNAVLQNQKADEYKNMSMIDLIEMEDVDYYAAKEVYNRLNNPPISEQIENLKRICSFDQATVEDFENLVFTYHSAVQQNINVIWNDFELAFQNAYEMGSKKTDPLYATYYFAHYFTSPAGYAESKSFSDIAAARVETLKNILIRNIKNPDYLTLFRCFSIICYEGMDSCKSILQYRIAFAEALNNNPDKEKYHNLHQLVNSDPAIFHNAVIKAKHLFNKYNKKDEIYLTWNYSYEIALNNYPILDTPANKKRKTSFVSKFSKYPNAKKILCIIAVVLVLFAIGFTIDRQLNKKDESASPAASLTVVDEKNEFDIFEMVDIKFFGSDEFCSYDLSVKQKEAEYENCIVTFTKLDTESKTLNFTVMNKNGTSLGQIFVYLDTAKYDVVHSCDICPTAYNWSQGQTLSLVATDKDNDSYTSSNEQSKIPFEFKKSKPVAVPKLETLVTKQNIKKISKASYKKMKKLADSEFKSYTEDGDFQGAIIYYNGASGEREHNSIITFNYRIHTGYSYSYNYNVSFYNLYMDDNGEVDTESLEKCTADGDWNSNGNYINKMIDEAGAVEFD